MPGNFYARPGRWGRRPLLWGKVRYNFYPGNLANIPAWSGDHALQMGKGDCNDFSLKYDGGCGTMQASSPTNSF